MRKTGDNNLLSAHNRVGSSLYKGLDRDLQHKAYNMGDYFCCVQSSQSRTHGSKISTDVETETET